MRYQNAPLTNQFNAPDATSGRKRALPGAQPARGSVRKAALAGLLLSLGSAFALSPGCKSYSTCEDTKTCGPGDGDGDGDNQGGMGGMGASGNTEEVSCTGSEIECDGACIDPHTDVNFCGATGSCRGASSGETCESDEICVDGACQLDCAAGLVLCDGTCIDPLTSNDYCGAGEGCSAAVNCGETLECVGGECFGWSEADTVDFGNQILSDVLSSIDNNGQVLSILRRDAAVGGPHIDTSNLFIESMQWSAPSQRNTEAAAQLLSTVFAVNAHGQGLLAWLQAPDNVSPKQLWVARKNPNGTWGAAETIALPEDAFPYTPSVSLDDDGNAYIAWVQEDQDSNQIWTTHRLESEDNWSDPVSISVAASYTFVSEPQLAAMPGGEALLVIDVSINGATPSTQVFASVSSGGTFPEATRLVGELPNARVRAQNVASDGQGRAIIVGRIHETPAAPRQVWIATLQDEEWIGPSPLIAGDLPTWVDSEQVVLDAAGRATVLWRELRPPAESPDSSYHLKLVGYDFDEGAETEMQDLPTTVGLQLAEPRLQTDALGNVRVAWWEYSIDQPYPRTLRTSRYRSDFGSWSDPTSLGEFSESISFTSLDLNASGHGILTWIEGDSENDTIGYSYFGPQTPAE